MPTVVRFRFWHKGAKDPEWGPNIVLGPFKDKDEVKTILIPHEIRKKFITKNTNEPDCDHFYVYTRSGYNIQHVAFRINFLVGQIGTGKKCVEKSWTATSPHRPIDCTTTTSSTKTSRSPSDNSGWNSYSNCWVSGKGCGDYESDSYYWESRQVTTTTWKDKTVNAPSYGGKNDCVGESNIDLSSTTVTEEQNVTPCGNNKCDGSSCSHCPGRPTCYSGDTATWKCNPGGSTGWTWDRILGS